MIEQAFTVNNTISKLKTNRLALIDADFIKYEVCSIRKKQLDAGDIPTPVLQELPIITILKEYMQNVFFNKIDDYMVFCFSGKSYNTFRNAICFQKQYKATRNSDETYPGQSSDAIAIVKYFKEKYAFLLYEDLEADDIVSALQDPQYTYIYSKDKDLKQVPGWHYDFSNNTIYEISNENAIYNLCYQLIAGDNTDCIGGFPMMGDLKAKQFLAEIVKPDGTPQYSRFINKTMELFQLKFGVFKGTDMFVEMWNLIKTRVDRGDYFKSKYANMYDVREFFINRIKVDMK